jgi:diaminopimelate epimerase
MTIRFDKYQGSGNDFVVIDNREGIYNFLSPEFISKVCDRHWGVGGDGLIKLEKRGEEIYMDYYNSDGNPGSMCGNGGRCFSRFAESLGLVTPNQPFVFSAMDGIHTAHLFSDKISLEMKKPKGFIKISDRQWFLDTGSPHHIEWVEEIDTYPVNQKGAEIRYGSRYGEEGSNVNFVEFTSLGEIKVRTYERGVEAETLSCGTGAVAVAQVWNQVFGAPFPILLHTQGGVLEVSQSSPKETPWLTGPAEKVFEGQIILP